MRHRNEGDDIKKVISNATQKWRTRGLGLGGETAIIVRIIKEYVFLLTQVLFSFSLSM